MIKFFRRIRQNLLNEGKTSKYFKYAIGEILLVMIGILLAIQVSNWNDIRKLELTEISILEDIKEDLIASQKEMNNVLESNKLSIKNNQTIYDALINDLPYEKPLDTAFSRIRYWSSPYLTFTAYETLKNKGIDIVKNDSIKKGIINIYESQFAYLVGDYDRSEWVFAESVVYPIVVKHIRKKTRLSAEPIDYEALKKDDEFINMINEVIFLRQGGVNAFTYVIQTTQGLIDQIDDEIKSRN